MLTGDLIRRMADAYAGAKTYTDRGHARYRHVCGSSLSEERRSVTTFLDRERGFRFETLDAESDNHVLTWSGQRPAGIPHTDRTHIERFVRSLLFSPFGRFGPAASTGVPSLLLPQEFGRSLLDDFHDPRYQGQVVIGTARCHRIFGHWRDETEVTLWLDQDHFLMRRMVDRTEYPRAREAAELREKHLRRRDHALAAGIPRKQVEQAFGVEELLAIKHWPYTRPRQDFHTVTQVAYDPQVGIPIDAATFTQKPVCR